MPTFLDRHLPDAALMGAFLIVLSVAVVRGDLSKDQTARALAAQREQFAANDSIRAAKVDSVARARQDSINRAQPGYVVDSILPIEEELRRFRAIVGPETTRLSGGASSRDALVKAFVGALEHSDSAALNRLTLNAREFAWLVYPSSPYTKPPFSHAPGLVWTEIASPSNTGRQRLMQRLAGHPLGFAGYRCDHPVERQGENQLYSGCVLELTKADGAITRTRLFGTIIERQGVFKIVSLNNDL